MKIALVLAKGVEGCGLTRHTIEFYNWLIKEGHEATIYAAIQKKWPRHKSTDIVATEFKLKDIPKIAAELEEHDVVYYTSYPHKSVGDEFNEAFIEQCIYGLKNPVKVGNCLDHNTANLAKNYKYWDVMKVMDTMFNYSARSNFANKLREEAPDTPLIEMNLNPYDYDAWNHVVVPAEKQQRRVTYFGRFAGFKDPFRMFDIMNLLKDEDFVTEARGVERSMGALPMFLEEDRKTPRSDVFEVNEKKNPVTYPQHTDKLYIYGPYNLAEGMSELGNSMFGAEFFNLPERLYGSMIEYAMSEVIAAGTIPLFDKHWGEHVIHRTEGVPFIELENFAIFVDRDDVEASIPQMLELAADHKKRDEFRKNSLRLAKLHNAPEVVNTDLFEAISNVKKRTVEAPKEIKTNSLF
jgi:hypothetical protein